MRAHRDRAVIGVEGRAARRALRASVVVTAALLAPGIDHGATGLKINPESQISDLAKNVLEQFKSQDWERSRQLIRQMAALDPDHPKVYLHVVLMQQRRDALSETVAELDRLALRSAPGRLYAQGILDMMERRPDAARETLGRALEATDGIDNGAGRAAANTALGNIDRRQDRFESAAKSYEAASVDLEKIGDQAGQVDILANLAKLERDRGRPLEAAARQREILAIREKSGDKDGQARSLHEIGICLMDAGDVPGALEALERALDLRRGLRDARAQI